MEIAVKKILKRADFKKIKDMGQGFRNQLYVELMQATGVSHYTIENWLVKGKPIPHWHIDRVTEIINQALEQAERAALEPQHQ